MNQSTLVVGGSYEVFNPKFGTFPGELIELESGETLIKHEGAGIWHETACNLAYCTLTAA